MAVDSTSANKKVLISGASIAGPALAYWLRRYGFDVTVVERSDAVRSGGYPIDIRGTALDVVERMGLLSKLQAAHIDTRKLTFVDASGAPIAVIHPEALSGDASGRNIELPRGALTTLLYEQTQNGAIRYRFNDSIDSLEDDGASVSVRFKRGERDRFDIVVGADGLHSKTRALVFGPEEPFNRYLGRCFNLFSSANYAGFSHEGIIYSEAGRAAGVYAVGDSDTLHALLVFAADEPPFLSHPDVDKQRKRTAEVFAGGGWEVPRLVEAMQRADDLFFDTVSQIHMPRWSSGRVGLVGDAAYAPSFLSGQGTSLALVGAYVLAGELAIHPDPSAAFASYEQMVRPFVEANQALAPGGGALLLPRSQEELDRRNRALAAGDFSADNGEYAAKRKQIHNSVELPDYSRLIDTFAAGNNERKLKKQEETTMSGTPEKQELMFRHTAGQANRFGTYFDASFTRVMGRGNYGGSAVGECYETASRIVDGDFQSYTNAWEVTAKRVDAIGWDCLKKGHKVSARDAFLRAVTYWGAATMFIDPTDPRQRSSYEKERACFREAAKLFDPPIEVVNIPYENGRTIPGYFIPGGHKGEKRPTVLVLGGGDSALEELYGVVPVGAQRRGYNVLMFEIPGQKAMFFDYPDLFFRHDTEVPIGYVVDYVLSRPEVDPGRITLIGASFGGYFAPRAAAFDKRLAAVIALPLFCDIGAMFVELLGLDPTKPYPRDLESRLDMSQSFVKALTQSDLRMRSGYANATIAEWLDGMREFTLAGHEKDITCPLLIIVGESEYDPARMEREKIQWKKVMNHPKSQVRIGTSSEGGEGHSMVNNLLLKNQIEFDWLDDVLGRTS